MESKWQVRKKIQSYRDLLKPSPLFDIDEKTMQQWLGLPWVKLSASIMQLTEESLWAMLALEKAGRRRKVVAVRLHTRAARLRTRRELAQLAEECTR